MRPAPLCCSPWLRHAARCTTASWRGVVPLPSAWHGRVTPCSLRATTRRAGGRPSTDRDGALTHERDRHGLAAHAVAGRVECSVGGAATGQSRRLGGAPFGIPSLEASDVEFKGSSAGRPGVRLRHQLIYGNSRIAGVARFASAWTTPDPSDAVMRQAPVPDLALDEKTERFLVHSGLAGSSGPRMRAGGQ